MEPPFEPIPGIWRFHLIYLLVTAALVWAFFPHRPYGSFIVVVGLCLAGLLLAHRRLEQASHILALAIGLGMPVVFFLRPSPLLTLGFFAAVIAAVFVARKILF
jgi:hypothetical protein